MPDNVDFKEYENLVIGSGGYREIELEILKDALASWKKNPGNPITILELRDGKILAAIAVASKVPGRDFTIEIRFLCVDRDYRSTRAGRRILEIIDDEILLKTTHALIQYETSTKKLEAVGVGMLENTGYNLIGHIPDFYGTGDDFYMYSKYLNRLVFDLEEETGAIAAKTDSVDEKPKTEDAR